MNAAQFFAKYKIAIIALVILVIVAIYFYRKGKKTTTIADLPNDVPTGGTGNGGVILSGSQTSANEIALMAEQVHEDINCVFCLRNTALYERISVLSDTDLIKLYNVYNSKFQAQDGETLLQALDNEFANFDVIKNRLRKYNVK